jgi:dephospho-CoA kinase
MLTVGLTGGIGSGKSTVSGLLAKRGAVVIDADLIAREVVEPGQPALEALVERFGPSILTAAGDLDRPALAAVAFLDEAARLDLNRIVHPAVGALMAQRLAEAVAKGAGVVVLDIPLLAEGGRDRYDIAGVVVVDAPPEVALARLVGQRGMSEADALARIRSQASREERLAIADVVIDNQGGLADLEEEVERAWPAILGLGHDAQECADTPPR